MKLSLKDFTKDGQMIIEFNQALDVPLFMQETKRRGLLNKNSVDMTKIIGLEFALQSDANPKKMKYFMDILEWTPNNLQLQINFADPNMISMGNLNDKISMKIKNPSYFSSSISGEVYEAAKQDPSGFEISVSQ